MVTTHNNTTTIYTAGNTIKHITLLQQQQ